MQLSQIVEESKSEMMSASLELNTKPPTKRSNRSKVSHSQESEEKIMQLSNLKYVLIAEDSEIKKKELERQLKIHGVLDQTIFCKDGQGLIDKVKMLILAETLHQNDASSMPISLLLLNLQMPRKNGFEVIKEV